MSVRITPRMLEQLAAQASHLPESMPLELIDGYCGEMKEHNRCVKLVVEGDHMPIASVKRFGDLARER